MIIGDSEVEVYVVEEVVEEVEVLTGFVFSGKLLKKESPNVKELLSDVYLKYKICFSTMSYVYLCVY